MNRKEYSAAAVKHAFWFMEFRKIVSLRAEGRPWEEIKRLSEEENIFGAPTVLRATQIFNTVSARVKSLDDSFYPVFESCDLASQKLFALVAAMTYDVLFGELMYELVREKMIIGSNELSDSDLRIFFRDKQQQSDVVAKWTDATVHGLPLSKGRFVDKNSTFSTVHPLVIRITGKKTIDLIRSLSDIETRQINGKRASFTEKTARDAGGSEFQEAEDTGKQAGGLARYLSKKEFCYKCKSPMKMVKGKRSSYLRCPKCDEKRWIDVRQIQLYIDMENVRCPKDKCDLEAKIGKFGLFIQCQAGHTLKLEEI